MTTGLSTPLEFLLERGFASTTSATPVKPTTTISSESRTDAIMDHVPCYMRNIMLLHARQELVYCNAVQLAQLDLSLAWPRRSPVYKFVFGDGVAPCDRCVRFMASLERGRKRKYPGLSAKEQTKADKLLAEYREAAPATAKACSEMHDLFMAHIDILIDLFKASCEKMAAAADMNDVVDMERHLWTCGDLYAMATCVRAPKKPSGLNQDRAIQLLKGVYVRAPESARELMLDPPARAMTACNCTNLGTGVDALVSDTLIRMALVMPSLKSRLFISDLYPMRSLRYRIVVGRTRKPHLLGLDSMFKFRKMALSGMYHINDSTLVTTEASLGVVDAIVSETRRHCVELANALHSLGYELAATDAEYAGAMLTEALYMFAPKMDALIFTSLYGPVFLPLVRRWAKETEPRWSSRPSLAQCMDACAELFADFVDEMFAARRWTWVRVMPLALHSQVAQARAYGGAWLAGPDLGRSITTSLPSVSVATPLSRGYWHYREVASKVEERFRRAQVMDSLVSSLADLAGIRTAFEVAVESRCGSPLAMPDVPLALLRGGAALSYSNGTTNRTRILPDFTIRYAGEEAHGPGVWISVLEDFFADLTGHTAFRLDEATNILYLDSGSGLCPSCSKVSFSHANRFEETCRSATMRGDLLDKLQRAPSAGRASEAYRTSCSLMASAAGMQLVYVMMQYAVIYEYQLPYLPDPAMFTLKAEPIVEALHAAGDLFVASTLKLRTDAEVAALDLGIDRVDEVAEFLHEQSGIRPAAARNALGKNGSLIEDLTYKFDPFVAAQLLCGRTYGDQVPNQDELWADAAFVACLFAIRGVSQWRQALHDAFDREIMTISPRGGLVFVDVSVAICQDLADCRELAEAADEAAAVLGMKIEAINFVQQTVNYQNLVRCIDEMSPADRQRLYSAVTSRKRVSLSTARLVRDTVLYNESCHLALCRRASDQQTAGTWALVPEILRSFAQPCRAHKALVAKASEVTHIRPARQQLELREADTKTTSPLPYASTCSHELLLSTVPRDYEQFKAEIMTFLDHSERFSAL